MMNKREAWEIFKKKLKQIIQKSQKNLEYEFRRLKDLKLSENFFQQDFRLSFLILISFTLGFFIHSMLPWMASGMGAKVATAAVVATPVTSGPGVGGLYSIPRMFRRRILVPGLQKDKAFVLSDFENEKDFKVWKAISSKMESSSQHPATGLQSAKIMFYTGTEISSVAIDDYFTSRNGLFDWSAYDAFSFFLYNPRKAQEHLVFEVRDWAGKAFRQDLYLKAESGEIFRFTMKRMLAEMDVRKISQISFFRSTATENAEFYLDAVRLLPPGWESQEEKPKEIKAASKNRPVKMLDYGFVNRKPAWLAPQTAGSGGALVRIPFGVKNETTATCDPCVAEGGIPLPMGEVKSLETLDLKNAEGKGIPFQSRMLAQWPDQSLKWIGISFPVSLPASEGAGFFLEYGGAKKGPDSPSGGIKLKEDDDRITVDTGNLIASWNKKSFYLFEKVGMDLNHDGVLEDGEAWVENVPMTLHFKGVEYRTDLNTEPYQLFVEEKGPQRVVIKASGWFESMERKRYCQAVVRYYLYQGQSSVKVSHTLVYTGYPENNFNDRYNGLKLPANETIQDFGITIPYSTKSKAEPAIAVGMERTDPVEISGAKQIHLMQSGWDQKFLEKDQAILPQINPFAGWLDLSTESGGIMIALRNFRENFPKAFRVDTENKKIFLDLWPKEAGELDLSTTSNALGPESRARGSAFGLAKTHEILFYFHPKTAKEAHAGQVAASWMKPLILRTNPYWVDATGALGRLYPHAKAMETEEKMLDRLFDWADHQPKEFKWYGMLDFGDTLTWWRKDDDQNQYDQPGWHPIGRWGWYGCEMLGLHTGALLQFVRTGDWKYFEFGENTARHIMDVDTVHYDTIANDPRLKDLLSGEFSRVGSMHEHNGDHWGGPNEEASHTSVIGILFYHYLSGNERARDVVNEVGEFFLKEPFTYYGRPDEAPNRAMANALWGDVALYQLTYDERYKKAADKIIEILLKGQQKDGSFLEIYNPLDDSWRGEKHQLYMSSYLLGAIMSYHELTQDKDVQEMLLRLVRYLGPDPEALHGAAYAYGLTGEKDFFKMMEKGLKEIRDHKQVSSDPLIDGLIYSKPIYHRPNTFLSSTPYVFEPLESAFEREANGEIQ